MFNHMYVPLLMLFVMITTVILGEIFTIHLIPPPPEAIHPIGTPHRILLTLHIPKVVRSTATHIDTVAIKINQIFKKEKLKASSLWGLFYFPS